MRRAQRELDGVDIGFTMLREDKCSQITRNIHLGGELSEEQRTRLAEIAERMPLTIAEGGADDADDGLGAGRVLGARRTLPLSSSGTWFLGRSSPAHTLPDHDRSRSPALRWSVFFTPAPWTNPPWRTRARSCRSSWRGPTPPATITATIPNALSSDTKPHVERHRHEIVAAEEKDPQPRLPRLLR